MPVPDRRRMSEYLVKGAHFAARTAAHAPEQNDARRLARHAAEQTISDGIGAGKKVLFLTPRDWSIHVQFEAMLAQALRLRGAEVSFMTCGGGLGICDRANTWESPPPPCGTCSKYVADSIDAHGFAQQTIRAGWEAADDDDWPELDEVSLADLGSVVAEGLPLGELTRIPVAWFLMKAKHDDDPLAAPTWRAFLRSARRMARGIRSVLDDVNPDKAVLLNGMFSFDAIALEICKERNIDVVTYERGFIKETMIFRHDEPAALTPLHDVWELRADRPLSGAEMERLDGYLEDRRHGRRTIDRYWDDADFATRTNDSSGRMVALFPNLTWDSAVIGQTVAFDSIQEWLIAAVDFFVDRPDDELVIRFHPAEVKLPGKQTREPLAPYLHAAFPELPPNVTIITPEDNASSYPIMQACDVGLVFTSTTGLELALEGKPVLVAGETHYRGKGFTLDLESPEDFRSTLSKALDDPDSVAPDAELARRYANLFFFDAAIDSSFVQEHVPGLARINVDHLAELAPGNNEAIDRMCDGILLGTSFVPEK